MPAPHAAAASPPCPFPSTFKQVLSSDSTFMRVARGQYTLRCWAADLTPEQREQMAAAAAAAAGGGGASGGAAKVCGGGAAAARDCMQMTVHKKDCALLDTVPAGAASLIWGHAQLLVVLTHCVSVCSCRTPLLELQQLPRARTLLR